MSRFARKSSHRVVRCLAAVTLAAAASSCTSLLSSDKDLCTADFVMVSAVVVDTTAVPVAGASVVAKLVRNGMPVTSAIDPMAGQYPIVDDHSSGILRTGGDKIHVSVSSAKGSAAGDYVVAGGECHIAKVSGPDTLIVR